MDRLKDEELKEVRIYPVREKVDIITMPQKRELEEIRRHLKDVLNTVSETSLWTGSMILSYPSERTSNQKDMTMTDYFGVADKTAERNLKCAN